MVCLLEWVCPAAPAVNTPCVLPLLARSRKGGRKRKWPPYALDPRDLERRYRELQWALHPDRLTGPGREAREVAHGAAAAALVNQAYGVLRSPLARANYLVE